MWLLSMNVPVKTEPRNHTTFSLHNYFHLLLTSLVPDEPMDSSSTAPLSKPVKDLVMMLFDMDVMNKTLFELEFDLDKMPLGVLSKSQISKGYQVLNEIQDLVKNEEPKESPKFTDLSNRFFSVIPHKFQRREAHSINTEEKLQNKIEMLDTLSQIQITYIGGRI